MENKRVKLDGTAKNRNSLPEELKADGDFMKVDFMTAVKYWDEIWKRVICEINGEVIIFPISEKYSDFKVDAHMILHGNWWIEV